MITYLISLKSKNVVKIYVHIHPCISPVFSCPVTYYHLTLIIDTDHIACIISMVCKVVHVFNLTINVTGFWKTVPNHTFLFQYIYHCNMKSIAIQC